MTSASASESGSDPPIGSDRKEVNVMPLRMLRALGRRINDLIETKVVVSAFIGEVYKTLGILPLDITIGSKIALSTFFVIDSTVNYNILLGGY